MSRLRRPLSGGIASPVWWAALAMLVVNDHIAKAAWPSWWTGKLSDVAGLIVAPVLAAALLAGRSRWRRALAFALVTVPFVAIQLSERCATLLVQGMALAGLDWRIVSDPTDVAAIAVLPVAWMIARPTEEGIRGRERAPRASLRWRERAGVMLGAAACLATSQQPTPRATWKTSTFLYNDTGEALDVRLRPYDGEVDCEFFAALSIPEEEAELERTELARALAPDAFSEGVRFRLGVRETLPLDDALVGLTERSAGSSVDTESFGGGCGVWLVQVEGMADHLVWPAGADMRVPAAVASTADLDAAHLDRGRIDVRIGDGGGPELVSRGPHAVPTRRQLAAPACAAPQAGFAWSATSYTGIVSSITPIDGGCFEVALGSGDPQDPAPPEERMYFCIPLEAWPFEVGDAVSIDTSVNGSVEIIDQLRPSPGDTARRVRIISASEAADLGPVTSRARPTACSGARTTCGAYELGATVEVGAGPDTYELEPGESIERDDGGQTLTVYAGSAARVLAAPGRCEQRRAATGLRHDLVLTWQ